MKKNLRKTLRIILVIAIIITAIAIFIWDPLFIPKIIAIAVTFILSIALAVYAVVAKGFNLELIKALLLLYLAVIIFNGGISLISIWF